MDLRDDHPGLRGGGQEERGAELLLRAAALAYYAHDLDRIRQLAEAALRQGFDLRAALLLGTALGELGRADEAVAVLAPAVDEVADTDLEATAMVLAWNCFYGSQGLAAAQEWLARAAARGGPGLRCSLGAHDSDACRCWPGRIGS
ncbi:hypothetical protein [Kitasatospora sp. NPDC050543]|uniref:hypothetical protein n=1 Tax=Kitasatospora sp. NPDC050543 TaxID=3364054 RepID=UPI003791270D